MSTRDFQGAAHAFKTFMAQAAADIQRGDMQPARVIEAEIDPKHRLGDLETRRARTIKRFLERATPKRA